MATKSRKNPPAPQATIAKPVKPAKPVDTGEAKLLLIVLFGLLGLAVVGYFTFSQQEFAQFGYFLRGQTGIDLGDLFSSSIFWKLFLGTVLGLIGGWKVASLVNPGDIEFANKVGRYGAIFLITLLTYIPAMSAGYIWDDDQEITANPDLKSAAGLVDIWTGKRAADYLPLKTTMLWVEHHLWENQSQGYHVVNIIVHAIAAMLLVVALKQMRIPGAWFAGLIFAIHPVHVESVAWVSERKNTLSLVFYLLTFIAYFKFESSKKWSFYGWALVAFVAANLCKSHVVVLPFALVLCCWWTKKRLTLEDAIRTVPFFLLSLAFGLITIHFQLGRAIGQEFIENFGPWPSRFAMAGMSVWWYLYKVICPDHLITIYPIWPIIPPKAYQFLFGVAAVAMFVVLWLYRNSWARAAFFAYAYFVATLLPVMGFIKMSYMRVTLVADHFQYLSDISIIALFSAAGAVLYRRFDETGKRVIVGVALLVVLTFSGYSWNRAGTFQGEETLWTDTLSKNENTWQAHNHMGAIYYMRQDYKKAIYHFKRGVELRPGNCEVQNNMGLVLAALGQLDSALDYYKRAVEIKGDDASIRTNYANGLSLAKRYSEAIEQYKVAVTLPGPNTPGIFFNMGNTMLMAGRVNEAIEAYKQALKLAPDFNDARRNLEYAERQIGLGS